MQKLEILLRLLLLGMMLRVLQVLQLLVVVLAILEQIMVVHHGQLFLMKELKKILKTQQQD